MYSVIPFARPCDPSGEVKTEGQVRKLMGDFGHIESIRLLDSDPQLFERIYLITYEMEKDATNAAVAMGGVLFGMRAVLLAFA